MRQEPSKTSAAPTMLVPQEPGGSLHLAHATRERPALAFAGVLVLAGMVGCGSSTSKPVVVNATGPRYHQHLYRYAEPRRLVAHSE
jgi:hypothetical protein